MGKKDFDDILLWFREQIIDLDSTSGTLSGQLDLDLPRGFIAKIKKVIFFCLPDEVIAAASFQTGVLGALLRDPDDITTVVVPEGTQEHDVIAFIELVISHETGGGGQVQGIKQEFNFNDDTDVITARNLRFNVAASGTQPDLTMECIVGYTLEEVKDADILNLLDIL